MYLDPMITRMTQIRAMNRPDLLSLDSGIGRIGGQN
jgi:hypothetical protein